MRPLSVGFMHYRPTRAYWAPENGCRHELRHRVSSTNAQAPLLQKGIFLELPGASVNTRTDCADASDNLVADDQHGSFGWVSSASTT
jgi:hypothetical protein